MAYVYKPFSVFYLERKHLEDHIPTKIHNILLEMKRKGISDEEKKKLQDDLNNLRRRRPCVVIWIKGKNILVMPISKARNEKFSVKIDSLVEQFPDAFVKVSSIYTFSIEKFEKISSTPKRGARKKLSTKEREMLILKIKELYKI